MVGAEKMKPELGDAFREKFHLDLLQGYGCTELSPVVSVENSGYSRQGPEADRRETRHGRAPDSRRRGAHRESGNVRDARRWRQPGMLLVKGPERDGGLPRRAGKDPPGHVGGWLVHYRRRGAA